VDGIALNIGLVLLFVLIGGMTGQESAGRSTNGPFGRT
jgi:hypothetical protein